jgi:iron complex outermembrane recepter protein
MPHPVRSKKTPVTLLALAISIALQATPAPAAAQVADAVGQTVPDAPADATTLDSVVVTGYRASLERALDIKRGEAGVVDAIVAEDIANFPDLNLAESLQRIPGVSITRDAGEGRNISVRGLGPDFTRVRINGMEALTTTGGTDSSGGANRGRGFDFNTFASELFTELVVRKTASAETEEGSLGATVDLRTARPFDYDGFTFVAGGQLGYNDLAEDIDPRATALISNTFADGRLGALLSVAYTERSSIEEGHSAVRWANGTSNGGFAPTSPFADARLPTTFHPRIPRYGVMKHDQQRLGVTGALQFKASDRTEFNLDMLHAQFDADRTEDYIEAVSFSRSGAGKPATVVLDGEVDARGNLVYGVFDNVDVRSESRFDELSTTFNQLALTGEHEFSDSFSISGIVGRSKSEFENPVQTTIIMDKIDADGYSWDYRGDDRLPSFDYGTVDVDDPNGWTLAEIRLRPQYVDNTFDNAGLDFKWVAGPSFTLKGGISQKDYSFESRELRRASEGVVPAMTSAELAGLLKRTGLIDIHVDGNASDWQVPDVDAFADALDIYSNSGIYAVSDEIPGVRGNNRSVEEQARGAYVQGDFSLDLGRVPVSGNIGVRHVRTSLESTGYALVGSTPVLTVVERDYRDTLPSLNLVAEVAPDFLVRFGAAKVMARAGLGSLTPGVTVTVSGGARTVSGGNPGLEPFRAKTYDLGFEWYFAEEALLSLGLFYKDIGTYVQTSREVRPFNTSGLPESLLEGTGAVPTDDFTFNIPLNTPGGPLRGFEIGYQQPFTFLSGIWSDFGLQLNYTYVESDIQYLTGAGAPSLRTDLLGLSKNAYNATLYYEGEQFSARASAAYRGDYLTTAPGRDGNDVEGTRDTMTVDASASWKLNDQVEFTLEGLNLTNEKSDQYVDSVGDRSSVYHQTGRQYMVGVRYRF